jgi:opacity protein-like surface antigen
MTRFVAVAVFAVVVMITARAADAQSPPTDISIEQRVPIEQVVRTALFADHDPARREAL